MTSDMNESEAAPIQTSFETTRMSQTDTPQLERSEGTPERFNIFEVIDLVRWETVHSRFLAFLLHPKQIHGLGNSFLAEFLRHVPKSTDGSPLPRANDDDAALGETIVHTEVYTDDGRIDILLLSKVGRWAMIVENKIDTTEHHDRLDRYYRYVAENYPDLEPTCVYLTPRGYEPSHMAYQPLGYGVVCKVIDKVLAASRDSIPNPDVAMSMEHYVRMVRKHIIGGTEQVSKRTLEELRAIAEDQGNGRAFATILNAARKHGLHSRINA